MCKIEGVYDVKEVATKIGELFEKSLNEDILEDYLANNGPTDLSNKLKAIIDKDFGIEIYAVLLNQYCKYEKNGKHIKK